MNDDEHDVEEMIKKLYSFFFSIFFIYLIS